MSNDFHSLLSVFRDATSTSKSGGDASTAGSASRRGNANSTQSTAQRKSHQATSTDNNSKSNNNNEGLDPTSTRDPSFSAPLLKERIERILRVQQIRKSTATATTKPSSNTNAKIVDGSSDKNDTKPVHIAICATIVDNFPHETLWRKWMDETGGDFTIEEDSKGGSGTAKNGDEKCDVGKEVNDCKTHRIKATAEMYVHAKNPERVKSEWLR